MTGAPDVPPRGDPADRYTALIGSHRARLETGHDPFGHYFAIERLARAARAEAWAARSPQRSGRRQP